MLTTTNPDRTIERLAYDLYESNLFKVAEAMEILKDSPYTVQEIENRIELEFDKRFRNNPYRARRYKKDYK